jgi:hypothetical protein
MGDGWGADGDDAVDVVGHHHDIGDLDAGKMGLDLAPAGEHQFAQGVQVDLAVLDAAKEVDAAVGADGDEVETRASVASSRQADRFPVVFGVHGRASSGVVLSLIGLSRVWLPTPGSEGEPDELLAEVLPPEQAEEGGGGVVEAVGDGLAVAEQARGDEAGQPG